MIHVGVAYRGGSREVIANCGLFKTVIEKGVLVDGTWGTEFVEGLTPRPDESVVTHHRVNPSYGPPLERIVRKLGAQSVIVAGVATDDVVGLRSGTPVLSATT